MRLVAELAVLLSLQLVCDGLHQCCEAFLSLGVLERHLGMRSQSALCLLLLTNLPHEWVPGLAPGM